jgi:hypothetical protein
MDKLSVCGMFTTKLVKLAPIFSSVQMNSRARIQTLFAWLPQPRGSLNWLLIYFRRKKEDHEENITDRQRRSNGFLENLKQKTRLPMRV